ncbi:DUF6230 family protein [Actinomadura hibisca]|uniref:DUF6230 family protein n=1 Tax=Actinomadura hibisca TaxID=68565 RepID=UPI00083121E8|nr:DUF6230 family protein [Actinomadura hibisca]
MGRARIRWGRFGVTLVGSLLVAGVLGVAVGQGSLAASFAVSGRQMKVSAQRIEGRGYATYPSVVTTADGRRHPVTVLAIRSARIRGFCQSAVVRTPLGRYVLRLDSAPGQTATVKNLLVSATRLDADLDFSSLQLNRDAATLDAVPGAVGNPGQFGLQALNFTVDDVKVDSWSLLSSSIRVQGFRLAIGRGERECFGSSRRAGEQ